MSLFARPLLSTDSSNYGSFHPLFRMLDDFDAYSKGPQSLLQQHGGQRAAFFNPRFDVKEHEDSYQLHGELPGVAQKDVELEFTDPQTLVVRGRSEREYSSGTPPAGALEPKQDQGRITEANDHHATVEETVDESEATGDTSNDTVAKANTSTEVTAPSTEQKKQEVSKPQPKYWVSERSVGSFSRSFSFPSRVDQDAVKASLKDGILNIIVPKARKVESRKITIESE